MLVQSQLIHRVGLTLLMALWAALPASVQAQSKGKGGGQFGSFGFPAAGGAAKNATFEASYELQKGSREGRVRVTASIADGWHMYSVSQPDGGPLPTKFSIQGESVKLAGPFIPDHKPDVSEYDVWPGLPIEEHHGEVTWLAPIELNEDIASEKPSLKLVVDGQVCMTDGACVPVREEIQAGFAGFYGESKRVESFRANKTHAVWTAAIEPAQAKPGESAVLTLTAKIDPGYHVYPFVAGDDETAFRTLIVAKTKSGLKFGEPAADGEIQYDRRLEDEPIAYYAESVQWKIPISIPADAQEGKYPIELLLGFMTCDDRSCDPPNATAISGALMVGSDSQAQPAAMVFAEAKYQEVASAPMLTSWIDDLGGGDKPGQAESPKKAAGLGLELWMVFAALAGGFILNFMPCVLPVIGLKLMSFVNQSGNNHSRVVTLNLSYVAGILSVMLVLAAANVGAKLAGDAFGWGQQFTRIEFQVPMAVLIFAMALSFLGVWEIPIPGFAMSSKSGELMEQEGHGGAFFKGILTTVLATPCSGPFLGTLFGLTLTLSVTSIVLLYLLVGLGLAMPYLALCVFPGFVKVMPKPGAWMETLKQVLAFPLLMTVVYFVAMIAPDYRIATLILLIFVWFACWLIGRVPAYAEALRFRLTWAAAALTTVLGAVIGFSLFGPVNHQLPWIPYEEAVLSKHRRAGKTVMIEFTARWCLTCQSNMKFAIDRPSVADWVQENEVVPLLADWSEPSEEILNKLQELDSLSIPLLAIYPADPQAEPIVLRDTITESQLLEALRQAGPSLPESRLTSTTGVD